MSTKLDTIKRELQKSPLFNLSLTNKELFHSNFLAWFGNTYKPEFKKLIEELLGQGSWPADVLDYKIDREFMHFDICVKDSHNKPRIVIENKVKSVPTKEQLDAYRNEVNSNSCLFILLTMTSQLHNLAGAQGWHIITYKDISDALFKVKLADPYHSLLLEDYRKYVDYLQQVIECFDAETTYLSKKEDRRYKSDLGIHDICGKRKAQILYRKLIAESKKKGWVVVPNVTELTADKVMVGWGFTNSQPLIDVKLRSGADIFVIQIQGNQYRHAVEYFDQQIGDRIEKIGDDFFPSQKGLDYLLSKYPDMYAAKGSNPAFYPFEGKFGNKKEEGYCKFCNGKSDDNGWISCFVHQWIPIPKDMTCDELVSNIIKDTEAIKNRHGLK